VVVSSFGMTKEKVRKGHCELRVRIFELRVFVSLRSERNGYPGRIETPKVDKFEMGE
jgi:hypothetical protein